MKVTHFDIEELELRLEGAKIDFLVERGWRKKPYGVSPEQEWVESPDEEISLETSLDHAVRMAIDTEWKAGDKKSHHGCVIVRNRGVK